MGDEQHRHAEVCLQVLEQREDLRLHGDVERGRRLVGDEQVGLVGERHGDHHALALAAGQLMRIGAEPRLPDRGCRPRRAVRRLRRANCVFAAHAVQFEDFADLPLDRVQRVERGHRLLEHHGDACAANRAQLRCRRP